MKSLRDSTLLVNCVTQMTCQMTKQCTVLPKFICRSNYFFTNVIEFRKFS